MFVDAIDSTFLRSDPTFLEPVNHIRLAAHWTDLDHLLETKLTCRNTRVDDVSQTLITLLVTLDHRGRVNACRSSEGVASKDRIIVRH